MWLFSVLSVLWEDSELCDCLSLLWSLIATCPRVGGGAVLGWTLSFLQREVGSLAWSEGTWPCSKAAVLRKEWMLANACLVFSGQTCGLGRRLGHLLLLLCWVLSNPVVPHNPCDGSSFPKLWLRSSNKTFPTLKMCFGWVQGSLTLTLNKATAYFHGRGGRICCLQAFSSQWYSVSVVSERQMWKKTQTGKNQESEKTG